MNKLNILLEGLDFRLYWNNDSNLYLTKFSKNENGNTELIYLPVKLASGMQTTFLGLSLIYSFHLLNIKNSLSHIFIDEYPILTFEFEPFIDKYWNIGLSQYIIEQYDRKNTMRDICHMVFYAKVNKSSCHR